jgi:adenosylcobinamide-GDP ribazoletransferase
MAPLHPGLPLFLYPYLQPVNDFIIVFRDEIKIGEGFDHGFVPGLLPDCLTSVPEQIVVLSSKTLQIFVKHKPICQTRVENSMDGFRRALGFLTIVPLRTADTWTPETLGSSMAYYPLVGLGLGLALWLLSVLLRIVFPLPITTVFLLGGLAVLTGGLHLDGLADTIDGLCGGASREEILRIFKDPHVGPMAVVGVVLVLLLKYASLNALPARALLPTLILMATLSRYSMVQLAYFSSYARASGGLGEPFVRGIKQEHFLLAVLLTAGVALPFGGMRGLLIWLLVSLATLGYQMYFRKRLNGITGDVLGATNELNEALVLLLTTVVQ